MLACAALAIALHLAFLDGVGIASKGAAGPTPSPISVRTIVPDTVATIEPAIEPAVEPAIDPVARPADPTIAPARPERERAAPARRLVRAPSTASAALPEASARSAKSRAQVDGPAAPEAVDGAQIASSAVVDVVNAASAAAAAATAARIAAAAPSQASAAADGLHGDRRSPATAAGGSALSTFPDLGDQPPPLYRTQLPPPATLRYQVRRGFLRGDGEIRWRPEGNAYRLVLEARFAGLTLLLQTSEGTFDANGLAPTRFLDQRARRAAQAANFVRDRGRITFSGTTVEWPLLAGSQDRLSWMIHLAGIAAADPELLAEGGRITMAVVGARGDASVWTLRSKGVGEVETARGSVRAFRLVREAQSAYDTSAEIWLDPQRSYFPAHATLRNSSGAAEYDLLLDRIDP